MSCQIKSVGIIGIGPMAIYVLKELLKAKSPLQISLFEADKQAGCGMPYRSGMNADYMYCNAFSREIPPITQGLAHWLRSQNDAFLARWRMASEDVDVRAFYPRVLLGDYLKSEFETLCDRGRQSGHQIEVLSKHCVTDIVPVDKGAVCKVVGSAGPSEHRFDRLVIATGHHWPEDPKIGTARLVSPWPYSNITALEPGRIGILGSSLSAIDAIVALAHAHGTFVEDDAHVAWFPNDGADALRITMVSHRGIMPEPDFYYPYPYDPLKCINAEAVAAEVAKGSERLLDRIFRLLLAELEQADPAYLADLGPDARTFGGFSDAYFDRRERLGGLRALRETLDEANRSIEEKETIGYRYALLRGHENFDIALPHLDGTDWEIFLDKLMPVFGDCYAAIPHVSVHRILALYDEGVLGILPTGTDSEFTGWGHSVIVTTVDGEVTFDALIDARGQTHGQLSDLPFPTLVKMIEDVKAPIMAPFTLNLKSGDRDSIICLAMPQMLERHPFSQGLPNCCELAKEAMKPLLAQTEGPTHLSTHRPHDTSVAT